jgi:hypothetical protein
MSLNTASKAFLFCSFVLSAYITVSKLGGLIVFGYSNLLEFCLFVLPVMALPMQMIAFWNVRLGLISFSTLTFVYLAAMIYIGNRTPSAILESGSHLHLYILTSCLLLLAWLAQVRATKHPRHSVGC